MLHLRPAHGTYALTTRFPDGSRISVPQPGRRLGALDNRGFGAPSSLTSRISVEAVLDALERSGSSAKLIEDTLLNLRDASCV